MFDQSGKKMFVFSATGEMKLSCDKVLQFKAI